MDWRRRQAECKKCGGLGYISGESRVKCCDCQPQTLDELKEAAEQEGRIMDKPQRGRPKGIGTADQARYQLRLPEETFRTIKEIADVECSSYREVLLRLLKSGIFLYKTQSNPEAKLILRNGDKEVEIIAI